MSNLVEHYILREVGRSNIFIDDAAYRYILTGNGILVQANNDRLYARIPIAEAKVRGLEDVPANVALMHGKVPQRFFDLTLSVLLANPDREHYVGILWKDNSYQLYVPEQAGRLLQVEYPTSDDVVIEFHSHPDMPPRFSSIDNQDEQGFKVYGVVSISLLEPRVAVLNMRVGIYGYFMPVKWSDIFDGKLDAVDMNDREKEEVEEP